MSLNLYCLEIGINLVLIEGCCGVINYENAVASFKRFYSVYSNNFSQEDIAYFEEFIKKAISNKDTYSSFDYEKEYNTLPIALFDAMEMFLGLRDPDFKTKSTNNELFLNSIDKSIIKQSIYTFLKHKRDFQILFLWPSTLKKKDKRELAIKKIDNKFKPIFSFSPKFKEKGFYQLFYLLYKNFEWATTALNHYSGGFVDKVYKCSGGSCKGVINIYFLDEDLDSLLEFKRNDLRELFNIGFHSAHSCDNKNEALPISQFLLNSNSLSLLMYSDFSSNIRLIDDFIAKRDQTTRAYSSAFFDDFISGKSIDPEHYSISCKPYKWDDVAYFYNSIIDVKKPYKVKAHYNPYKKFVREYKFVKFKSHLVNNIKRLFKR